MTLIIRNGKDYEVRHSGQHWDNSDPLTIGPKTTYIVTDVQTGIFLPIIVPDENIDGLAGQSSIEDFAVDSAIPTLENEYYQKDFMDLVNAIAAKKIGKSAP